MKVMDGPESLLIFCLKLTVAYWCHIVMVLQRGKDRIAKPPKHSGNIYFFAYNEMLLFTHTIMALSIWSNYPYSIWIVSGYLLDIIWIVCCLFVCLCGRQRDTD